MPLSSRDGHEVGAGFLHGFRRKQHDLLMVAGKHGAGKILLMGHKHGALRETRGRKLVGGLDDVLHPPDIPVQLLFHGFFHEMNGNKEHHSAACNQCPEERTYIFMRQGQTHHIPLCNIEYVKARYLFRRPHSRPSTLRTARFILPARIPYASREAIVRIS